MLKLVSLIAITLVAAGLAGCATDENPPTPTTNVTAATPTPTGEPTPTTVVVPTVPTVPGTNLTGGPTSVNITHFDTRGDAGGKALVCWRVEGTGSIPHTAVHFDNESHEGANVTFAAYDGGAVYPGNTTTLSPAGYALPGDFCAGVPVPASGKVYFRAHALLTPPGILSGEAWSAQKGNATNVTITTSPATLAPGASGLVCWMIEGTGNVAHVAVHFDNEAHNGTNVTFASYDLGAAYPDNATSLDPMGYDLPNTFCTNLTMPATGDLYYRGHVIDAQGPPGRLSDESEITRSA